MRRQGKLWRSIAQTIVTGIIQAQFVTGIL